MDVSIYNCMGQLELHKTTIGNKIDVSMLKNGIYIVEIRISNDKYRTNLIIRR